MTQKIFKPDPIYDNLNDSDLVNGLMTESPFIRSNFLIALSRRCYKKKILEVIKEAIMDTNNVRERVMGVITVSMVGIIGIIENGDDQAKCLAIELINQLPEVQKEDLLRFFKQEGINLEQ